MKTELLATSPAELAEQFSAMGLPVTEYRMLGEKFGVRFGEHTWAQVSKNGAAHVSHYTGSGSCSWAHDLTSYIDVALVVCDFLLDCAPMPYYMARIFAVTGIEDRDMLRTIEDMMRAENSGLLDGLSRHEFDKLARRIVREL